MSHWICLIKYSLKKAMVVYWKQKTAEDMLYCELFYIDSLFSVVKEWHTELLTQSYLSHFHKATGVNAEVFV